MDSFGPPFMNNEIKPKAMIIIEKDIAILDFEIKSIFVFLNKSTRYLFYFLLLSYIMFLL